MEDEIYGILLFVSYGFAHCLHELGVFIIIWFVTFKYWETAKKLSMALTTISTSNQSGINSGLNSIHARLKGY